MILFARPADVARGARHAAGEAVRVGVDRLEDAERAAVGAAAFAKSSCDLRLQEASKEENVTNKVVTVALSAGPLVSNIALL